MISTRSLTKALQDVDVCLGGESAGECASSFDEKRLANTDFVDVSPEALLGQGGLVLSSIDVAIVVAFCFIPNMIHASNPAFQRISPVRCIDTKPSASVNWDQSDRFRNLR